MEIMSARVARRGWCIMWHVNGVLMHSLRSATQHVTAAVAVTLREFT